MKNYYEILEIPYSANNTQIKTAYRSRIKRLHPDICSTPYTDEELQEVLVAYKTLIDCEQRAHYDKQIGVETLRSGYRFRYRHFLMEHIEEGYYAYRLVLYELLHSEHLKAIHAYETFAEKHDILACLPREDAMDCLFLLAESYILEGDYLNSFFLFAKVLNLEKEKAYFRHFIVEILKRVKYLVLYALPNILTVTDTVHCLQMASQWDYTNGELMQFKKAIRRLVHGKLCYTGERK